MQDQTPREQTQPGTDPGSTGTSPMVGRFRNLASSLLAGTVVITGSVAYTLGEDAGGVSVPMLVAVLGLLAAGAVVVEAVGYRTRALGLGLPREEARRASVTEYQERMVLRFMVIEAALVIAVVLAYVVDGGVVVPMVLAGAGTVVLMLVHVYPREKVVARIQQSLERDGATSHLRETVFGSDSPEG